MIAKPAATRVMAVAALVLFAMATSGSAQIQANGECVQAKTWHLQQAMKVNLAGLQDYHLGAAQAADELSTMGGSPCADWKSWANGDGAGSGPVVAQ